MKSVRMTATLGTVFAVVVGLLGLIIVEGPLTDAGSDPATIALVAGTATIPEPGHFYADTTSMSTDDGTAVTYNATTRTITGTGTATVSYLKPLEDSTKLTIFTIIPFFLLISVIGAALGGAAMRAGLMSGGGGAESAMQTVIEVTVMVILIPVITAFEGQVREVFEPAPRYIGVTTALSLVTIAYMLQLLGTGVGAVRSRVGGRKDKAGPAVGGGFR